MRSNGKAQRGFEADHGAGAVAKDDFSVRRGHDRVEIGKFDLDPVVRARWARAPPAATVEHSHAEVIGKCRSERAVMLAGAHAAMDDDQGRAGTKPLAADGRAIGGGRMELLEFAHRAPYLCSR
jgi:hypothetical protein